MTALRVLAYHAIADLSPRDPHYRYGVPLADLQDQVRRLAAAGCTFIDGPALRAYLGGAGPLPPRPVLMTFDDCSMSIAPAVAWLAQQQVRGIAFAISGALRPGARIAGVVEPLLDRDGLAALVDAGFEIGAHGHSHRKLPEASGDGLRDEVDGALRHLNAAGLGMVRMFAYPFGAYNQAVCECVRRSGAAVAMTVDPGFVRSGDDPFRLRRIEIFRGDTGVRFLAKVATAGGVARIRSAIRLRSRLRRLSSRHP